MTDNALHSRSRLAGYDPGRLALARVLVVGMGALGQNIVQTLALSGVGRFLLVDFDEFEDHNATRSPFFPNAGERARFGGRKAACVAHRVSAISTADTPEPLFSESTVQRAGDGCVRWADVVVSAVDGIGARAWLAERARLHGKPMLEGGFSGPEYNYSAFSGEAGANCYRCFNPVTFSSMSCREYAREAARHQIVPAIQSTAAVLAGMMVEQVMNVLHDDHNAYGLRFYGDIRRATFDRVNLAVNPDCPGEHDPLPVRAVSPGSADPHTVSDLLEIVRRQTPDGWITPSEPLVRTAFCTRCGAVCQVRAVESSWARSPRCAACDGPWPSTPNLHPGLTSMIPIAAPPDPDVAATLLADLGMNPGGYVAIVPAGGERYLLEIPGDPVSTFSRVGG
ncbi:HesA/MoeB/ThiF family protein [Herbidospora mongoliensis]|uniref:HesA/MoeB/ThiF family protein n=1 Tax=Herbidospora mongoliensis TaxID=688067 RepID=UPI0008373D06|nr:ThiF family adenylyltransferase [Herbidospora mongoliensis]